MGKSEITKQFIIEKAAPIFNKSGYAGTSISDITKAIGLTKGAVYGNFSNKDDIALEALEYNFREIYNDITGVLRKVTSICDRLKTFARYYRDNFDAIDAMGGCPILNAAIDSDDGNPHLRKKVQSLLKVWETSLIRIVEKGIERKEINPDTDARAFASLFISLMEGGIMLNKSTGKKTYLDNAVAHIETIVDRDLRI
ncbi:MAG: TetR/AcrR family transcriptional regulator [Spirochaetes bacterium]|nr:TetR/AcrR family transcriptional regulator [Spirochaetota bacterium]